MVAIEKRAWKTGITKKRGPLHRTQSSLAIGILETTWESENAPRTDEAIIKV